MFKDFFLSFVIIICFQNCSSQEHSIKLSDSITRVEMKLSAFGVEADDYPSIVAQIDFLQDTSRCEKSYYNPAYKALTYRLSPSEIKNVLKLLKSTNLNSLKPEYSVSRTDQPTSTITIYSTNKNFIIKDYGLEGAYPLKELYKIVYKF
jgi:hypothetical protein